MPMLQSAGADGQTLLHSPTLRRLLRAHHHGAAWAGSGRRRRRGRWGWRSTVGQRVAPCDECFKPISLARKLRSAFLYVTLGSEAHFTRLDRLGVTHPERRPSGRPGTGNARRDGPAWSGSLGDSRAYSFQSDSARWRPAAPTGPVQRDWDSTPRGACEGTARHTAPYLHTRLRRRWILQREHWGN